MAKESQKDPPIVESLHFETFDGTRIPTTYLTIPMPYDDYKRLKIISDRHGADCVEMIAGMMIRNGLESYIERFGLRSENDKGDKNNQPED